MYDYKRVSELIHIPYTCLPMYSKNAMQDTRSDDFANINIL